MRVEAAGALAFWLLAGASFGQQEPPPEVYGEPAAFGEQAPEETLISLAEGSTLRRQPAPAGAVLKVLPEARLPVLGWRESWVQVRYGELVGWVDLDATRAAVDRPPAPTVAERWRTDVDPERLDRALGHLGEPRKQLRLGAFELHTDVADGRLLRSLERLVVQVEEAYSRRYGLALGEIRGSVVLFRHEEDYRALMSEEKLAAGFDLSGYSVGGLSVLYAGAETERKVESVLLHELVHVLSWQTLTPPLQVWLDEGLAGDLSLSAADRRGRLREGELDWASLPFTDRHTPVNVRLLAARQSSLVLLSELFEDHLHQRLPSIPELLAFSRRGFMESGDPRRHYLLSTLWVRYLLDDAGASAAAGFRAYLAGLHRGAEESEAHSGGLEALRSRLGREWPELERDFWIWLRSQIKLLELGIG